jgi:hypothetical protein
MTTVLLSFIATINIEGIEASETYYSKNLTTNN